MVSIPSQTEKLRHKVPDHRAERIHVHEEGIMPANAIECGQLRILTNSGDALRQFTLLLEWEQDIGAHAHYECAFELQSFETRLQ